MRLVVDSMIALMLVGILAGVLWYHRQQTRELEQFKQIHHALAQLYEQALYHSGLQQDDPTSLSPTGFPLRISPLWFTDRGLLPLNVLAPSRQPWIDVAPAGDAFDQPPDPVIRDDHQAGFWYNPTRGVFRARVPRQLGDAQTLALYNQVNGVSLLALPHDDNPARAPGKPLSPALESSAPDTAQTRENNPASEGGDGLLTAGVEARTTLLGLPPAR